VIKRPYDEFHLIDGSKMLSSDVDVQITYEDSESPSSGFDQSGVYHRSIDRYNRRSWKFSYAFLTKEEFVYLKNLMKGKATFRFSFLNEEDKMETVNAYAQPLSVAYQSKRSGLFKGLTIEIVEC